MMSGKDMAKLMDDKMGGGELPPEARAERLKMLEAMGEAIVEHIQLKAELVGPVAPGLVTDPSSFLVTGGLKAGPAVIK